MRQILSRIFKKLKEQYNRRQIEQIMRRVDAMPTLDDRPANEILGYDENGLPR